MRRAALIAAFLLPLTLSMGPGADTAVQSMAQVERPTQEEALTHLCDGNCHPTLRVDSATPSLESVTHAGVVASGVTWVPRSRERHVARPGVKRLVERPPARG